MIPAALYTDVFNLSVLGLVALAAAECYSGSVFGKGTRRVNAIGGVVLAVLLTLFIGLRPVSPYYFGDTYSYAVSLRNMQVHEAQITTGGGDWVFNIVMRWFAAHGTESMFFLFCAFVYVGALWWALVRIFGRDYFVPLVVAVSMFTFWSYGVNGVRNGMASSVLILALTFRRRWPVAVLLAVVAMGIHRSMMLTGAAAAAALVVRDPRWWMWGWVGSIAVSLVAGGVVSEWLTASGLIGDERFASYITSRAVDDFSHEGFRWDFLLYSSVPVAVGGWFIFRKGYTDRFYLWLFNIYLATNAFWILVIRANFSNRFAQLSWFIMPLVLIYPFFMRRFWGDQPARAGTAVVVFYLYTFYSVFLQS